MLKPSVTIVQSEHNADSSERRRFSLPNQSTVDSNGQNNTNWATQLISQHHYVGSAPKGQFTQPQQHLSTQVRSFASSMDFTSTSLPGKSGGTLFPPIQKDLFQASSHHTSHTAAAGDLLSMSRVAFEGPKMNQNSLGGKKRSVSIAGGRGDDVKMNEMSKKQQNSGEAHHVSANPTDTTLSFYNNGFNPLATTKLYNTVSSSTFVSQGGSDESYQQHRTIRRCQRSDSFEMMEDE